MVVYKKSFSYLVSFKSITGGDVVVVNRGGGNLDLKEGDNYIRDFFDNFP